MNMPLAFSLIVIVILTVVWVLSNVIRAQQEVSQQNARKNANRNSPASRPAEKHTAGDIESFLQEIERLRKKGQDEKPKPIQPSLAQPQTQLQRPPKRQPQPQPRRQAPEPRPRSRPRVERASSPPAMIPLIPELLEPVPGPAALQKPTDATQQGFSIPQPGPAKEETAASRTGPSSSVVTKLKPLSPIFHTPADQLLHSLLQSRQGPAVAILLQEIFGEPRCRTKKRTS